MYVQTCMYVYIYISLLEAVETGFCELLPYHRRATIGLVYMQAHASYLRPLENPHERWAGQPAPFIRSAGLSFRAWSARDCSRVALRTEASILRLFAEMFGTQLSISVLLVIWQAALFREGCFHQCSNIAELTGCQLLRHVHHSHDGLFEVVIVGTLRFARKLKPRRSLFCNRLLRLLRQARAYMRDTYNIRSLHVAMQQGEMSAHRTPMFEPGEYDAIAKKQQPNRGAN